MLTHKGSEPQQLTILYRRRHATSNTKHIATMALTTAERNRRKRERKKREREERRKQEENEKQEEKAEEPEDVEIEYVAEAPIGVGDAPAR